MRVRASLVSGWVIGNLGGNRAKIETGFKSSVVVYIASGYERN
jgi:hypothetical protein